MARSHSKLLNMATRLGFRLAKARAGSQHLGLPVRYLLEGNGSVLPLRGLEEVEQKLNVMEQVSRRVFSYPRESSSLSLLRWAKMELLLLWLSESAFSKV